MSIGTSLEMKSMLKVALGTFLRKLNCSAGSVYSNHDLVLTGQPRYALPHRAEFNPTMNAVRTYFPERPSRASLTAFSATLPIAAGDAQSGFYYFFELPKFGFLALLKQGDELPAGLVKSLQPLVDKLASACLACLQNEELNRTYRETSLESNVLRTLINNTPIIVFALDKQGTFIVSEGYGLTALGRKPGEVVGQSIFEVYRDVPLILNSVQAALDGEPTTITVDIAGLSFDTRYEPVLDETDQIVGVVGVAHDVTARQVAQETLEAVLNTMGEGVATTDEEGTIVMVNRETERIFRYESGSMVGMPLAALLSEVDRGVITRAIRAYRDVGESTLLGQRVELQGERFDSQIFPLELLVAETKLLERTLFTVSIRDITHRKELDLMRDEFIANVSHELRTPLTSIMGWTETLLSERPGPLTDLQKRFLDISYKSSQRLSDLVEEILTVSRIQRGSLRLDIRPISPTAVLGGVINSVGGLASAKSIKLTVANDWPNGEMMMGDTVRLEQMLTNLISNAIKFSGDGEEVRVFSQIQNGNWNVIVEDQGIGIPADDTPKLFQRFFRATNATDAQIQGTGLGLFVCKAIIEGHNGDIFVESEENVGTKIHVMIPLASPTPN